jgi:hypothetical protein
VLVEIAADLGIAGDAELALGFAAAMEQTVGRRLLLVVLALDGFARFAKVDDVTHALSHPLPSMVSE